MFGFLRDIMQKGCAPLIDLIDEPNLLSDSSYGIM